VGVALTYSLELETALGQMEKKREKLLVHRAKYATKMSATDYAIRVPEDVRRKEQEALDSVQAQIEAVEQSIRALAKVKHSAKG
jgi:valyl-tRNA synthetase